MLKEEIEKIVFQPRCSGDMCLWSISRRYASGFGGMGTESPCLYPPNHSMFPQRQQIGSGEAEAVFGVASKAGQEGVMESTVGLE